MKYLLVAISFLFLMKELPVDAVTYITLDSLVTQVPFSGGVSHVKMDSLGESNNIDLSPSKDKVIVKERGVYVITAEGQIGSLVPGVQGYMDIWLVKNGIAITNSNNRTSISRDAPIGLLTTSSILTLSPGDTIATAYTASGPSLGFIFLQPDNEPAATSFSFQMYKLQ